MASPTHPKLACEIAAGEEIDLLAAAVLLHDVDGEHVDLDRQDLLESLGLGILGGEPVLERLGQVLELDALVDLLQVAVGRKHQPGLRAVLGAGGDVDLGAVPGLLLGRHGGARPEELVAGRFHRGWDPARLRLGRRLVGAAEGDAGQARAGRQAHIQTT